MTILILDIETNTKHDTIWCCVTQRLDTNAVQVHTSAQTLRPLIQYADTIVGHNIIGFDGPVLRNVWDVAMPVKKIQDTLVMSRLLNPVIEGGHSLRAWGQRLGNYKDDFSDYDGGLSDEMIGYCKQDVAVTAQLYKHLLLEYAQWDTYKQSLELEHLVAVECAKQERNGFKLDVPSAEVLHATLQDRMSVIEEQMQEVFQPIVEERWSEKTGKRLKDKITIFNPGSRQQIATRLQQLGWKPQKYTETGQAIVDETTLEEADIDEAKLIAEYLMIQKRVGLLDSWLKNADEETQRVHGRIITNGAITGRMTHHSPNMGQIPSVTKPYGEECRKLWTVEEGNVLIGCDLAGIELRCLAHYMQDAEWTKELLNGDIHTKNQLAAGLQTRAQAKTFIYATLYGAGPAKIGLIVGGGAREGNELLEAFYRNTPKLASLMQKVQRHAEKGYVPGLDGRRIHVRSAHAALNTLLQGCGAIIAKQWCVEMHKLFRAKALHVKQVAFVHDEIQIEGKEGDGEQIAKLMVEAAASAGKTLGFRCPVDAEAKIGQNWYDTH